MTKVRPELAAIARVASDLDHDGAPVTWQAVQVAERDAAIDRIEDAAHAGLDVDGDLARPASAGAARL